VISRLKLSQPQNRFNAIFIVQSRYEKVLIKRKAVEDCILRRGGVIAFTCARFYKTKLSIKSPGGMIRLADFQEYRIAILGTCLVEELTQQASSDTSSAGLCRDHNVLQLPFVIDSVRYKKCQQAMRCA